MTGLEEMPFLKEKGHIISLVGGGGKTTLLYAMARCCAAQGRRVLVTTTTHIQCPAVCYVPDEAARDALWATGHYAVAGTPAEHGKLTIPPSQQLADWMAQADTVFIEADGAKHYPCKAPAAHEPVILPECDIVLAVAGLSALGKPLKEVCFRLAETCDLLNASPNDCLTMEFLAKLLSSERGGRKSVGMRRFCVVLNQADDPDLRRTGEKIREILAEKYHIESFLTHFMEGERA